MSTTRRFIFFGISFFFLYGHQALATAEDDSKENTPMIVMDTGSQTDKDALDPELRSFLHQYITKMNQQMPIKMGKDQLLKQIALEGNTLVFYSMLANHAVNEEIKTFLEDTSTLKNFLCKHSSIRIMLEKGVNLRFIISSQEGKKLGEANLSGNVCENIPARPLTREELVLGVQSLNKACPIIINEYLSIISVQLDKKDMLIFSYQTPSPAFSEQLHDKDFQKAFKTIINGMMCDDSFISQFLSSGSGIRINFMDPEGKSIFKHTISGKTCKNQ